MSIDTINRIIEDENSQLRSVQEGITEGILEGIKEGVKEGVKKGIKDGLKECLTGSLGNISQVDIKDLMDGINEEIVKATVKESAKHIFGPTVEVYVRGICIKVVNEVQKRDIKLTEDQISSVINTVIKSEQKIVQRVTEKLLDNPLVKEFFTGIQAAFQESMDKELKLCGERLRQRVANHS